MLTMDLWSLVLTAFLWFCVVLAIYSFAKNQWFDQTPGYGKSGITKPSLWSFSGIGDFVRVLQSVKNGTVLSYLDRLWSRYGDTYAIGFFGTRIIFTRDAVNIKHILAFQWLDYDVTKDIRTEMFKDVAPGTIASVDGKAWEDERRKWRRSLAHHHQILDLAFLEKSFRLFLNHIPAGKAVDVQPLVLDMMTDIIRNFIIGESAHRLDLENQTKETRESTDALERLAPRMALIGLFGPLSWLLPRADFLADCRLFRGLLLRTVQKRLKVKEEEHLHPQSDIPSQPSLLDRLSLHATDPETLRNDLTSGLMASESVARPLSHCIWLLSQHPEVYEKLRQSVLDVVGPHEPTHADLNKFPYLISVLNEGNVIENTTKARFNSVSSIAVATSIDSHSAKGKQRHVASKWWR
jgi:cytochrome P450